MEVTLRDFVGLEESEPEVIHAMTSFSYHVAVGNLDEAFKAIQSIKRYGRPPPPPSSALATCGIVMTCRRTLI